jgi:hypothetical protein
MLNVKKILGFGITFLFLIIQTTAYACSSCLCTLISDWGSQGLSSQAGWSVDVRYDYLNQNKLWSGTSSITKTAALAKLNNGKNIEVEDYTKTTTITTTLDYNNGDKWGVSVLAPYLDRSHHTFGTTTDGDTDGAYTSQRSDFGDVRVIGRYYGFSEQRNIGVQFGLKLPTGSKNQLAKDGVTPVDPGLQIGTGTTDLILGAYYHNNFNREWGYFGQTSYQLALDHSNMKTETGSGTYRPGKNLNVNAGIRYEGFEIIKPILQINSRIVEKDSGSAADTYATGGKLVYLSPGAIIQVNDKVSLNANIQLPIYQNVNGVQLVPDNIISIGARIAF